MLDADGADFLAYVNLWVSTLKFTLAGMGGAMSIPSCLCFRHWHIAALFETIPVLTEEYFYENKKEHYSVSQSFTLVHL
jgi:hypothetical protein